MALPPLAPPKGAISSIERVFAIGGAAAGPVIFATAREVFGEFTTVLR